MTKVKWLETEYCGSANDTVQSVLVGDTLLYVLFAKGYNYVFDTIYQLHLYWNGAGGQYRYTCESEKALELYLRNFKET